MVEWAEMFGRWIAEGSSLAMVGAFLGGVLASMTPCTYPVLPLTVAFIGHQAVGRRKRAVVVALLYVGGMATVYTAFGMVATLAGQVFGFWAGRPWVYLLAGNICLLASFVMLGWVRLPHLTLFPRNVGTTPGKGAVGAFAMGAVSAFLLGPCTTPVLGAVLAVAAVGADVVRGATLLFSFSLGLGCFVVVLSAFCGLVVPLPRSGRWLLGVQRGFALLMMALAQYLFLRAGSLW